MTTDDPDATHSGPFEENRGAMYGAAYRVLGTVQDSEDAVQEAWLRWREVDVGTVRNPRGYLLRTVTRVALNMTRSRQRRREDYPGTWLPEPVDTDIRSRPGEVAEIADEVSLALLVVLEKLSALERAAFVLREVFGLDYAEVAAALDRSEPAVRQLVRRARAHVREEAPRNPVDPESHREITELFFDVIRGEEPLDRIVDLLAPDIVLTADSGGEAKAFPRPIRGTDKVYRLMAAMLETRGVAEHDWRLGRVNDSPAVIGVEDGAAHTVFWLEIDGGRVTRMYVLRNPEKLRRIRVHD